MSEIVLENLIKAFGGVPAVRGANLSVAEGEFMTLVGPSGCGKSTVLNMIAGLEDPDRGSIKFDGKQVNALSPRDRDVAFVFQSYALYPHKTVRENLAFPLNMMKLSAGETEERIKRAAELLGLGSLMDRMPRELSGGQRQRVALGRAIVRKPRVFLLDEPLSNLDAKLRVQMRAELKKLHEELGITFIYVTHDQTEAMTLSDRVAIMNDGIILQVGTPAEIYGEPASQFVASFIGSPPMNFFPVKWDLTKSVTLPGGAMFQPDPRRTGALWELPQGATVTAGIRPEHLRVYAEPAPGGLSARVYVVEPTGAECFVTVVLGGAKITVRAGADFRPAPGSEVGIEIDPERMYFFHAENGNRLK